MCGRYTLFTPLPGLERRFDVTAAEAFSPRYNAAPGQRLPVVFDDDAATLAGATWGFVPPWSAGSADRLVNARAESAPEKETFADAYRERRCLVPADGFYEWVDGQPYRVTADEPFAMAGLWTDRAPDPDQTGLDAFGGGGSGDEHGTPERSFAVLTTDPNDVVADLHHRMAVVLPEGAERAWLEGTLDRESVLTPYPGEGLRTYPVSTAVNDPANDSPSLVEPQS